MEKVRSDYFIVSIRIFDIFLAILLTKYLDLLSPNMLQTTVILITLRCHYCPLGGAMSHTSVNHQQKIVFTQGCLKKKNQNSQF